MKARLGHLVFFGDPQNVGFYKDLFEFLEWKTIYDEAGIFGTTDGNGCDLWFEGESNGARNDHDGDGLNHLAVITESQADVDTAVAHLKARALRCFSGRPAIGPNTPKAKTTSITQPCSNRLTESCSRSYTPD